MYKRQNADIFRFGIGKYFSFSVSSLEAKNSKPNRAHFDKAIKIMGDIKIDEILHIGDHQVNDILALMILVLNHCGLIIMNQFGIRIFQNQMNLAHGSVYLK